MEDQLQELSLDRVPPHNLEAELTVLGSFLLGQEAIAQVADQLEERAFYKEAHQHIYRAILALETQNQPVDVITLAEELRKRNLLDQVGGITFLAALATSVPTAAHIGHYATIVREKYLLRQLIAVATRIVTESYEQQSEPQALLDRAESAIFTVAERRIVRDVVPMKEIIKGSIETIDNLYQRKGMITGLPTGFEDLDQQTAGLHLSDLIIIAGRPSMGKSALALGLAEHLAVTQKIPVALFSVEMSRDHLVQRMLCSHARINAHNVRRGILSQADWPKLTNAAGKLSEAPMFIDDSPNLSIFELRAKARRLKARQGIQCLVLDYLQLMEEPAYSDNRQQEIAVISRQLKALARELDVALLAVSQLSRAPERRENFRPRLSDLRESGAIEQDADLVLLLFREEYYTPNEENKGLAEIIIAKQRHGPVGTVKLAFLKDFVRFENLSPTRPAP